MFAAGGPSTRGMSGKFISWVLCFLGSGLRSAGELETDSIATLSNSGVKLLLTVGGAACTSCVVFAMFGAISSSAGAMGAACEGLAGGRGFLFVPGFTCFTRVVAGAAFPASFVEDAKDEEDVVRSLEGSP